MQIVLRDGLLDTSARSGRRGSETVRLTDREWALIEYLAQRPGRAVAREALLAEVWRYHPNVLSRVVDATVNRLRAKIEENPADPIHLVTVYGFGYRLDVEVRTAEARRPAPIVFGRETALARLDALGRSDSRIAVIGAPGIGKSFLVRAWLGDRGRWVDLGAASSAADLERALQPIVDDPPEILVLDDVDLVVEPLCAWLDAHRSQRVVVTARERTTAAGEVVLRLTGLDTDAGIALFLDRARRLGVPDPSIADLDAIKAIVEWVDGIPLAIAYAAGRSLLLPPTELIAALADGFGGLELLGASDDGEGRRWATMRHALSWTWHRLRPWEQAAVAQLSVFEGGFTLDAAVAVLDLGGVDPPTAIDVLQGLVDKCLCHRWPDQPRWVVYRVFRDYVQQRMTLDSHHWEAFARFTRWAVGLARTAPGPDGDARIAGEHINLRHALTRLEVTDPDAASIVEAALDRTGGSDAVAAAGPARSLDAR